MNGNGASVTVVSMLNRRIVSLVATAVLVSSCSGGGSSPSSDDSARTDAASGLAPAKNGFAFANFGSANTPEFLDGEDLRLMFGDGACANGTATPCDPTAEAAAWAQMVNQSREAGHCEGMVVQAVTRFTAGAAPVTAELSNEDDTTHGIIRAFATQFFPAVKKEADSWAKKSLEDIVGALSESFSSGTITYTMGLYSDVGGHAVLPISVEYPTETTAKVHIYDSNWPGADRYVLFDFDADTWEFSFSGTDPANDAGAWTGGKGDIDLASMESRVSTDTPFDTGSDSVLSNFLIIRSASLDWSVTTPDGTVTPRASTDPNATVRPLRSAASKSVPEYMVSTSSTNVDVTLPGAASAYAVGGGKVVSIVTKGSKDPVSITPTQVSFPATAEVSLADNDLAATVIGGSGSISIGDTTLNITAAGLTQQVQANDQKPEVTVTIKNGKSAVSTGSTITRLQPTLPADLAQPDTKPGLPPQDSRTLSSAIATSSTSSVVTTSVPATTTTVKTNSTPTTTATTSTTSTTVNNQNNIVALQYMNGQMTWTNGQAIPTMQFRFINANNQWASTASGTCVLTLLPEFDNGSLGGAGLSGTTTATASGTGTCSFSGTIINGTVGTKYRLRASLTGTGASTTLPAQTLN